MGERERVTTRGVWEKGGARGGGNSQEQSDDKGEAKARRKRESNLKKKLYKKLKSETRKSRKSNLRSGAEGRGGLGAAVGKRTAGRPSVVLRDSRRRLRGGDGGEVLQRTCWDRGVGCFEVCVDVLLGFETKAPLAWGVCGPWRLCFRGEPWWWRRQS